jgi:hypothetical protein
MPPPSHALDKRHDGPTRITLAQRAHHIGQLTLGLSGRSVFSTIGSECNPSEFVHAPAFSAGEGTRDLLHRAADWLARRRLAFPRC